jgi:hypothetical protein
MAFWDDGPKAAVSVGTVAGLQFARVFHRLPAAFDDHVALVPALPRADTRCSRRVEGRFFVRVDARFFIM